LFSPLTPILPLAPLLPPLILPAARSSPTPS